MFKEISFLSAQAVTIILNVNVMNSSIQHLQNREPPPWALTIRKAKVNPPPGNEGEQPLRMMTPITSLRSLNAYVSSNAVQLNVTHISTLKTPAPSSKPSSC